MGLYDGEEDAFKKGGPKLPDLNIDELRAAQKRSVAALDKALGFVPNGAEQYNLEEQAETHEVRLMEHFASWFESKRINLEYTVRQRKSRMADTAPMVKIALERLRVDYEGFDLATAAPGAVLIALNYANYATGLAEMEGELAMLNAYWPYLHRAESLDMERAGGVAERLWEWFINEYGPGGEAGEGA